MNIRQYRQALRTIEACINQTNQNIRKLVEEVIAYEAIHYPFDAPTPAEALKFRMEHAPHTQTELAQLVGSRSRASEYIKGKRKPSKRDALRIHKAWGISLEVLLR